MAKASTVPRRRLGRELKALLDLAGVSVDTMATHLQISPATAYRMLKGITWSPILHVKAWCELCEADAETTAGLVALAAQTKAVGWWHSYGDVPEYFELLLGLESEANRLRVYQNTLIPGLLQTKAYATEVYRVGDPERSDAEIERGVAVRLGRQKLLTRNHPRPPRVEVMLEETVLHRSLRDREEMAAQLRQLTTAAELPNVSIRVLPVAAGLHRVTMANGAFDILYFPPGVEQTTVYSDSLNGALYQDNANHVVEYEKVWASAQAASLDEADSSNLINSVAKELS